MESGFFVMCVMLWGGFIEYFIDFVVNDESYLLNEFKCVEGWFFNVISK